MLFRLMKLSVLLSLSKKRGEADCPDDLLVRLPGSKKSKSASFIVPILFFVKSECKVGLPIFSFRGGG